MKRAKFNNRTGWPARACAAVGVLVFLGSPVEAAELLISSYNPSGAVSQVLRYDAVTGAPMPAYDAGVAAGVFIGPTVPGGHGELSKPYGLLLGNDGNVYVASLGTNSVKVYDGTTGHYLKDFVAAGSGGLSGPWGMCWGPDGNLYVASSNNSQILRYEGLHSATPGAFMGVFASGGGLSGPRGVMFGNDQWTGPGQPPGPAQDGYPDLYVASTTSGKILRYHGQTGAYVDVFADVKTYCLGAQPTYMVYEQFFRRNDPWYNQLYTGNALISTTSNIQIHQGSSSDMESAGMGLPDHGFYGAFPNTGNINYNGNPVWGPNHSPANSGEKRQSLFLPDYWGGAIRLVGANEGSIAPLIPSGVSRPQGLLIKCGRQPGTLIRKVTQNRLLWGTVGTVRLQGDNMAGLMPSTGGSVSLRKMRNEGVADGTATIPGQNYQLSGDDLLVDFDLTSPTIEAGRYSIQPNDSCRNAMWFPEAVLIYLPTLTNASFEEGWTTEPRENNNICVNPSQWDATGGGNKNRPKHWDQAWGGTGFDPDGGGDGANQFDLKRDGNIWHPCDGDHVPGLTGLHYASLQHNFTLDQYYSGMYQSIAAPEVAGQTSLTDYSIYIDACVASWQQISRGQIRLIDGDNYSGALVAQTDIPNTQSLGNGLIRSPEFRATVPAGYVYQSNPPILTIEFVWIHSGPDAGPPEWGNVAAFHLDNVRSSYDCTRSPWADADGDGDVDQRDFGSFQQCYTGSAGPAGPGCACFDRDHGGLIDENDFIRFQDCFTGPAIVTEPSADCR
ncbi:MAG TPA: hypothetical protein PKY77_06205 [Phycisphaerae bacterium]|nr:hypothetical protein [Phycisphaerae bacterium]HRY69552.1 hypothetical protein [Phycisphaerae bacterium]HSA29986.1 hypothetical protein [Phycisphaerae bacterium]